MDSKQVGFLVCPLLTNDLTPLNLNPPHRTNQVADSLLREALSYTEITLAVFSQKLYQTAGPKQTLLSSSCLYGQQVSKEVPSGQNTVIGAR